MSELRVIIADDERPARLYVRGLLEAYDDVRIVGEAATGTDAVTLIEREAPDLALLDLQMPELNGIEVVQMLRRDRVPLVAFITAFDDYAVSAFSVKAVDYLLKPVDAVRLRQTVSRAHDLLEQRDFRASELERISAASALLHEQSPPPALRRIPVRRREDIIFVPVSEIASVSADGEVLWITTLQGERYLLTYRLKDLEARLDAEQFVRVSRGALVNVDAIAKVSPMPGAAFVVVLKNKQQFSVSRSRSRVLRETLLRL